MKRSYTILFLLLSISTMLTSCGHSKDTYLSLETSFMAYVQSPNAENRQTIHHKLDSLEFRLIHHYSIGFNFVVTANHIILNENDDTCMAFEDDPLVVMDIHTPNKGRNLPFTIPSSSTDSVWLKVANENGAQGWISETDLLNQTIPDDSLSAIIVFFGSTRMLWISIILILGLCGGILHRKLNKLNIPMVKMVEMDSIYPFLLIILFGFLACCYTFVLNNYPAYWNEYFFHPTLNPFILPFPMNVLIITVWTIIITFIALLIDIYHHFHFIRGVIYLMEILGASVITYMAIEWTAKVYVGYLLFLVLTWFLFIIYKDYVRCKYQCPNCGMRLHEKGKCPHCGIFLE